VAVRLNAIPRRFMAGGEFGRYADREKGTSGAVAASALVVDVLLVMGWLRQQEEPSSDA